MDQITLGRTGLSVSRLGFGALFAASFSTERTAAIQAVHRAVELGITYFDTAPTYGDSEDVLGTALAEVKKPVVVSTKIGGKPSPFDPKDAATLIASVKNSLKVLRRDHIDVLMIHEPDRPQQYAWWTDIAAVTGPVLDTIDQLKREGLIRHAGLGGTSTTEMAHLLRSGKFDVVLTAFQYNLLYREAADELLPAAKAHKVGVIAGSPLQQGMIARRFDALVTGAKPWWLSERRCEQLRRLYRLVDDSGIALPEMGIRFMLSNPDVHCVLMGARSAAEVEINAAAIGKGPLPRDVLTRVDEIAAMLPQRPYGEPVNIGWVLGMGAHTYGGMGSA